MNACQTAYAAAGKTVRFHAWFPVFGDEYAAKNFGGQSVYFDKGLPGNVWGFLTRAKPDCMSDMFADPSNSAAINYELSILGDLIKDYPALSGINLDYIRYVDPGTICNGANRTGTPLNYVNPAAVENFVKLVKARFPSLTLSADVIADSATRVKVGQEGILQYLDMIVPMVYSYTDNNNSGSSTVKDWVKRIRDRYPSKILLPLLRGYTEGITNPYSKGLMTDLASDLSAVKTVKIDGYGIFTYEYLLDNANAQKLSCIKKKIGY